MRRISLCILCAIMCVFYHALPVAAAQDEEAIIAAFYDDAVLVGDSVMQQIGRYKMAQDEKGRMLLGRARFLTASSYTLYQGSRITPLTHKVAFRMGGERISLSKALKRMGAGKAIILLGLNDQAGDRLQNDIKMYARLIDLNRKDNPHMQLIAMSVTPIMKSAQTKTLNQKNFDAFNEALQALCEEQGLLYLDMASHLKDDKGFLNPAYFSEDRVHLNREGMEVFIERLRAFALEHSAQP